MSRFIRQLASLDGHEDEKPVSLPVFSFRGHDIEAEVREAFQATAEKRVIRAGRDAWEQIRKSESFTGWLAIGAALAVGRDVALRATGANAPMGRNYSRVFSAWIDRHGFARMPKSTRSVALELHEHAAEITAWRDALPEKQRKRLIHPLSVTRRWKASTAHGNGKCPADLKREAAAAWRRFIACVEALPRDQAAPFWQAAQREAATAVG